MLKWKNFTPNKHRYKLSLTEYHFFFFFCVHLSINNKYKSAIILMGICFTRYVAEHNVLYSAVELNKKNLHAYINRYIHYNRERTN